MIRLRTSALAVAIALFPAVADAACAWVLWEEFATTSFRTSPPTERMPEWRIVRATPAQQECDASARVALNGRAQQLQGLGKPSKPTDTDDVKVTGNRVSLFGAGTALTYTYVCLPDTIDPRGPNGAR